jgi:predicted transposase YdaD
MKTDSLFYELFKLHPKSLSELAGLETEGEYVFESITVKSTEKRMDGFFRRKDSRGADIFLEVQGYDDRLIYWRLFREISTRYEQTGSEQPFVAIILFIDEKYDPKNCPVKKIHAPEPPDTSVPAEMSESNRRQGESSDGFQAACSFR